MYQQIADNKRRTWLLLIGFVIFLTLIAYLIAQVFGYGYDFVFNIGLFSVIWSLVSYYVGPSIVLATAGARRINKEDNPYVYNLVENLCIASGQPLPKIYISPEKAMNAFATGRDPKHASICLTSGIIENLENEELEGVIAHELSHIKNYDIKVMTLAGVLVGIIVMISDIFVRSLLWGGRNRDKEERGSPILMVIGLVLVVLSPIIAQIIQLAISRRREFLADASGVLLTRYPLGLANALRKISQNTAELRRVSQATAHLYIANPFKKQGFLVRLFSTHPAVADRIKALKGMEKSN